MSNCTRTRRTAGLMAVAVIMVGCGGGDERAIKKQMTAIATALTVPANDGELGRITRIASLRNALPQDIQVSTGVSSRPGARIPPEVVGRDAVLALAARWALPATGVT